MILDHVRRYLALYYGSDDDVVNDQALGAWVDNLDRLLPNGVRGVLGQEVTLPGIEALLATVIYLAVVEHEITGSGLWDYQLWSDTSPVRIYEDGRDVPLDVYQRLVNANLTLNVNRTMLLNDGLADLALDTRGSLGLSGVPTGHVGLASSSRSQRPRAVADRAAALEGKHQRVAPRTVGRPRLRRSRQECPGRTRSAAS